MYCMIWLFFQIMVFAAKGNNKKSWIAVDEFEFLQSEICELYPPEAKPIEPTTTPVPTTTTPEPTEPPGRNYYFF